MTALPARVDGDACKASFPAPQLVVSGPPTVLPQEAPASLGVAVESAPDDAQLVICGFAPKSVFSAGRSIDEKTWTLQASDVADASLIPPQGFVGPMKLIVVLVSPGNGLADRRTVHLQWLPQPPGTAAMSPIAEVSQQLVEGKRLKAAGNLVGARAIFLRLAQDGDSRAAFLLAESYDPISLAKHQLLPPNSDPEKARLWYRRASQGGSQEANARLERLSNW
jgi:TPR repeat protein